jgi:archaellum component FlaF (FlaF/FlaG flagellin family)
LQRGGPAGLLAAPVATGNVDYMVQDTISNALLIIAVVISTTVVLNAVYPAVMDVVGSVRSATGDANSRSKTAVTISSYSFSTDYGQLNIWMKNSGKEDIVNPADIRVYYGDDTGSMKNYNITARQLFATNQSKTTWSPGETYQISFTNGSTGSLPHDSGLHRIRVVLPNGAISETTITI